MSLNTSVFICFLNQTEKFSEMKDEIPQAVIDSHVQNAANARAEKVKQETSEENTGKLKVTNVRKLFVVIIIREQTSVFICTFLLI